MSLSPVHDFLLFGQFEPLPEEGMQLPCHVPLGFLDTIDSADVGVADVGVTVDTTHQIDGTPKKLRGRPKRSQPYRCNACGNQFRRYCHYEAHTVDCHNSSVTIDQAFTCDWCVKSFCYIGDLRRHLALHGVGPKYPCNECGRLFVRSDSLFRHTKIMHSRHPHEK